MAGLRDFFRPQAQGPGASSTGAFGDKLRHLLSPEIALPMAAALLGNEGNKNNFANALGAAGSTLKATKSKNQTLEYLRQAAPEYADMIEKGGLPVNEAWESYLKERTGTKAQPPSSVQEYEYAKQQGFKGSFTDWQTKGVKTQDPTFGREQDLRKEYGATPEYKRYDDVRAAYERVRTSAQMDSGAGDIGTIFGYMKMLDPGSVVREGEFATAQNSSGIPDRVRNMYNAVVNGERLTPEQRAEFVRVSDGLYQNEAQRIEGLNTRFSGIAGEYQLEPNRVVQQPKHYEPLPLGGPPQDMGNGITIRKIR